MVTTIDVVTQEDVIKTADVSCLLRRPPNVEEAHQVVVVAVDVPENFDRRLQVLDQIGLCSEHMHDLIDELKYLLLLNVEGSHRRDCCLSLTWLQQVFDEE